MSGTLDVYIRGCPDSDWGGMVAGGARLGLSDTEAFPKSPHHNGRAGVVAIPEEHASEFVAHLHGRGMEAKVQPGFRSSERQTTKVAIIASRSGKDVDLAWLVGCLQVHAAFGDNALLLYFTPKSDADLRAEVHQAIANLAPARTGPSGTTHRPRGPPASNMDSYNVKRVNSFAECREELCTFAPPGSDSRLLLVVSNNSSETSFATGLLRGGDGGDGEMEVLIPIRDMVGLLSGYGWGGLVADVCNGWLWRKALLALEKPGAPFCFLGARASSHAVTYPCSDGVSRSILAREGRLLPHTGAFVHTLLASLYYAAWNLESLGDAELAKGYEFCAVKACQESAFVVFEQTWNQTIKDAARDTAGHSGMGDTLRGRAYELCRADTEIIQGAGPADEALAPSLVPVAPQPDQTPGTGRGGPDRGGLGGAFRAPSAAATAPPDPRGPLPAGVPSPSLPQSRQAAGPPAPQPTPDPSLSLGGVADPEARWLMANEIQALNLDPDIAKSTAWYKAELGIKVSGAVAVSAISGGGGEGGEPDAPPPLDKEGERRRALMEMVTPRPSAGARLELKDFVTGPDDKELEAHFVSKLQLYPWMIGCYLALTAWPQRIAKWAFFLKQRRNDSSMVERLEGMLRNYPRFLDSLDQHTANRDGVLGRDWDPTTTGAGSARALEPGAGLHDHT